ncbi:MAG: EVE domain-containing protein [Proteobacteria bacterium]|nr:EVE domain-containing protein [Pseudomonadota bacterium]
MTNKRTPGYWLMKSEPDTFSIDDLLKAKNQTSPWDGVRNYQARNYIRDEMKIGDLAFFYHSSCKVPGIVGLVEIVKSAYPDHTALEPKSPYYDPKSSAQNPRWYMVDVKFKQKYDEPLSLEVLKMNPKLKGFKLLNRGNRLSILPVSLQEWKTIQAMI